MVSKNKILTGLAQTIFIIVNISYFFFYKEIRDVIPNFLSIGNYLAFYFVSVVILRKANNIYYKTMAVISAGLSLSKVFYNIFIVGMDNQLDRRSIFVLMCLLFMILHIIAWVYLELNKKNYD